VVLTLRSDKGRQRRRHVRAALGTRSSTNTSTRKILAAYSTKTVERVEVSLFEETKLICQLDVPGDLSTKTVTSMNCLEFRCWNRKASSVRECAHATNTGPCNADVGAVAQSDRCYSKSFQHPQQRSSQCHVQSPNLIPSLHVAVDSSRVPSCHLTSHPNT